MNPLLRLCWFCALALNAGLFSQIAASFEVSEIRVCRERDPILSRLVCFEHLCLLSPWISELGDSSDHGRVRLVSFREVIA